jgi:formylmethanofuran dehydrogenase subunit E
MEYEDIIAFHGHSCPGLAIGYLMTKAALASFSERRSEDEELVAIVGNNACGVDALQYLSGCTFGKGNLVFRDYGKHVYTICSRKTGKGVRVSFDGSQVPQEVIRDRQSFVAWLLREGLAKCVSVRSVSAELPERAQIQKSVRCSQCGEGVMESRVQEISGKPFCIPCAEKIR